MSNTELIQTIVNQFSQLSRSEKLELIDIFMRHVANEVKQENIDNFVK
jgi:nucleoid DNA-binding protein